MVCCSRFAALLAELRAGPGVEGLMGASWLPTELMVGERAIGVLMELVEREGEGGRGGEEADAR